MLHFVWQCLDKFQINYIFSQITSHVNSFVASYLDSTNCQLLILGMSTLGLNHCCTSSRHTLNQILHHFLWNSIPFLFYPLPQLIQPLGWNIILIKPLFEMIPEMFNGIKVWRLSRPVKNLKSIVFEPGLGQFGGVLGVVVLLEYNIAFLQVKSFQGLKQFII